MILSLIEDGGAPDVAFGRIANLLFFEFYYYAPNTLDRQRMSAATKS